LTVKQVQRYETCKAVLEERMTTGQAGKALGLSRRQIQRVKRRIETDGPAGVIHRNTGREPPNKVPKSIRQKVINLAATEYVQYNFSHLADTLGQQYGIELSDETLRLWLRPMGHGRVVRRRKKHYRRRKRRAQEGELLFLDGSPHQWFGQDQPYVCLLLTSDDATGKPLWGKFQPTEDRDGCFQVCYHVFRKFGIPAGFYLDRASQFKTTRYGGLHVKQGPNTENTHFQRAMKELGIELIFAHSPQARGRGERLNGSFQDRLVAELEHEGIKDCAKATEYLNKVFIPRYCRRFGKQPASQQPAWRNKLPAVQLKQILCAKYVRTVANDNTVSLHGTIYQLYPPKSCYHLVKARIEVQQWFDGTIHFWHQRYGSVKGKLIKLRTKTG